MERSRGKLFPSHSSRLEKSEAKREKGVVHDFGCIVACLSLHSLLFFPRDILFLPHRDSICRMHDRSDLRFYFRAKKWSKRAVAPIFSHKTRGWIFLSNVLFASYQSLTCTLLCVRQNWISFSEKKRCLTGLLSCFKHRLFPAPKIVHHPVSRFGPREFFDGESLAGK